MRCKKERKVLQILLLDPRCTPKKNNQVLLILGRRCTGKITVKYSILTSRPTIHTRKSSIQVLGLLIARKLEVNQSKCRTSTSLRQHMAPWFGDEQHWPRNKMKTHAQISNFTSSHPHSYLLQLEIL